MDCINSMISGMGTLANDNKFITIITGILFLVLTSGFVVKTVFKAAKLKLPDTGEEDRIYGRILGKCENIIIYILVLLEGYTALALIFTGKAIVRSEDKNEDKDKGKAPSVSSVYHLTGTMINTAYSILISFIIKFFIGKITEAK